MSNPELWAKIQQLSRSEKFQMMQLVEIEQKRTQNV